MSQAKIAITTTGAVTRALSSRRSLFGGAAAVVLGGGITAGLSASVADLVEPPRNPDAVLIALCREYVEHSTQHSAACNKQDAISQPLSAADDAEWNRLDDCVLNLGERMGELEDMIPTLPALTQAGQRAKAEALLHLMQFISHASGGTLARSLAHDLVGRA